VAVQLAQLPIEIDFDAGTDPVPVLEALDCLRVAVTIYDSRSRLLYLNQHFNYLFRSLPPAHALVGRGYEELVRIELAGGEIDLAAHPGGEEAFVAARCAQLAAEDYAPRDIHLADGRVIEIKIRRTADGGRIALWTDVTHARHDYGRLQHAIEMSADAFAFWDRNDRLVMCNPGFSLLHGHRPDESLVGMPFEELIASAVRRGLVKFETDADAWIEKRLEAHRAPAGALTVVMTNGSAFLVRERATRDGGHATIYTDVTDRHRAEAAFADQAKALSAKQQALDLQVTYLADLAKRLDVAEHGAAEAKATFLRTMGHELKTPLNAIIGFSDLLKTAAGHFSGEQVVEYAGLIHMAGGNLLTMLNQILDLTKIAAGRYPLKRTSVSARGLLDAAYDLMAEKADEKTIALKVLPCPAELAIDGDENALGAMIGQIAKNAVAFTHNGGTITLSAAMVGARVRLRIEDDGPGVATEDLARIVEPFEQAGAKRGGSGLGLPLAKALAELHGGSLTLESALGEGLAATIELPAS
jgi:PAS domain S-box-containing protein